MLLYHWKYQFGSKYHSNGSCAQVYNERIYDLLNDGVPPLEGWKHLELKEDSHGRVFVDGLKEVGGSSNMQSLSEAVDLKMAKTVLPTETLRGVLSIWGFWPRIKPE